MSLTIEIKDKVATLILNRPEKNNAFDDALIIQLISTLEELKENTHVRVICLEGAGKHFSAGADLNWMQRMANYSMQENITDAKALAKLLYTLHTHPKPTIAVIRGAAFGGGAGLIAACDMAIAETNATFCFSEVKLGLIPAVISPYVMNTMGEKMARYYFLTAEVFTASDALKHQLIQHVTDIASLDELKSKLCQKLCQNAPTALQNTKQLMDMVRNQAIDDTLIEKTALAIASQRVSEEGQMGLNAFIHKQPIQWEKL